MINYYYNSHSSIIGFVFFFGLVRTTDEGRNLVGYWYQSKPLEVFLKLHELEGRWIMDTTLDLVMRAGYSYIVRV